MEIRRTLVLSTGHLPWEAFKALTNHEDDDNRPFRVVTHEYGVMLILSDDKLIQAAYNWPQLQPLKPIVIYALSNHIQCIDFDRDGPIEDNFKHWDW